MNYKRNKLLFLVSVVAFAIVIFVFRNTNSIKKANDGDILLALDNSSPSGETLKLLDKSGRIVESIKDIEAKAQRLAQSGSEEDVRTLVQLTRESTDQTLRGNLFELIRDISNPAAIEALADCASDTSDLELHRPCRDALSDLDDPRAAEALLARLAAAKNGNEMEPLAYAVAHLHAAALAATLAAHSISTDKVVSEAAIQGLGSIGDDGALRFLLQQISTDTDEQRVDFAKIVFARSVAKNDTPETIGLLWEVLKTGTDRQADAVIEALTRFRSADSKSLLEQAIRLKISADRRQKIDRLLQILAP